MVGILLLLIDSSLPLLLQLFIRIFNYFFAITISFHMKICMKQRKITNKADICSSHMYLRDHCWKIRKIISREIYR